MAERVSGVLMHPTALPGRHGIGDLGAGTARWLDWLAAAGQRLWQVLPLGPTGLAGSPYDGGSSFAGDPLLISLDELAAEGLLETDSLEPEPPLPLSPIDLAAVRRLKGRQLRRAWSTLRARGPDDPLARELDSWAESPEQASWCEDWTLFAALRNRFQLPWTDWPPELRDRRIPAISDARQELRDEIGLHRFGQFVFWRQWAAVRREANRRGIRILGDLPIYAALDSAEVWCHRELFDLDPEGRPRHLSGVPPDAYSAEGQLWGHPLYRWDRMREEGYAWWIERLRHAFGQTDLVRIDHFRGFAAYWEVPVTAATAAGGRWLPGPGNELFDAARQALGRLPLIAEDLGQITDDVRDLRRALGVPGMRVLQFGLEEGGGEHLPESWQPDLVAYTATHDNDTSVGWFGALEPEARQRVRRELGSADADIHWAMIRAVLSSVADTAIIPLQDLLGLGSEARFNTPGRSEGNWGWRFGWPQLTSELGQRLRRLTELSRRLSGAPARVADG
jgi:4-alpha-glucanotransferase